MLATVILAVVSTPISWAVYSPAAAVAAILWTATLLVQWLCIEPPDVEEKDLH